MYSSPLAGSMKGAFGPDPVPKADATVSLVVFTMSTLDPSATYSSPFAGSNVSPPGPAPSATEATTDSLVAEMTEMLSEPVFPTNTWPLDESTARDPG